MDKALRPQMGDIVVVGQIKGEIIGQEDSFRSVLTGKGAETAMVRSEIMKIKFDSGMTLNVSPQDLSSPVPTSVLKAGSLLGNRYENQPGDSIEVNRWEASARVKQVLASTKCD